MDLNVRVAGEAGQGVQTTGRLLLEAFAGLGLHVHATMSYMSRIRGGLNWYDVRIGDRELFSGAERADLLVALTDAALQTLGPHLADGGLILYDGKEERAAESVLTVDFSGTARQVGGSRVMANAVAAGAAFGLLGYDVEELCSYLSRQFARKGREVVEANIACARRGAELVKRHSRRLRSPRPGDAPGYVISGAEAVGLSAATAGVKLVAAYPMTPSTATFTFLAGVAEKYGIVVEQAEDEIAAINMVCGAVYAGVPAMTTTSGGGFALMVEGLALAGMLELPVLVLLAQRPGPATGLPTRTAQQDLKFALSAGHGEFARAVFAPGTLRQCYDLTRHALQIAHKYQTPAILLTDQFLQDLERNIPPLDETLRPIDRCIVAEAGADYARYALTDTGVSPRAIPGGESLVVVDSDEHLPDGHISEDLDSHLAQQDKRMAKLKGLSAEALAPEWFGPRDARTVLMAWGSTYGPCRAGVECLNEEGGSVAMMHFAQVWPVNVWTGRELLGRRDRVICVEGNCTGQLASLLREAGLLGECELLLRYDGLPFTGEYIASRVRK